MDVRYVLFLRPALTPAPEAKGFHSRKGDQRLTLRQGGRAICILPVSVVS